MTSTLPVLSNPINTYKTAQYRYVRRMYFTGPSHRSLCRLSKKPVQPVSVKALIALILTEVIVAGTVQ